MHTIINDSIHGTIQLDPLCVKIIDTPQFQRLRRIKQLGTTYYVYPGASHNRFEHSIGVSYLAGKFVEILRAKQDLGISKEDILCVKIAGLCHDLGHGPFSHVFEKIVNEIRVEKSKKEWTHEQASTKMLVHLIKDNKLEKEFRDRGLEKKEIVFIKRLIHQKKNEDAGTRQEKTGRDKNKEFLYQIVANGINGLDVDKWDYFARDCHMLGIKNNFDHQRSMQLARVCDIPVPKEGEPEKQICFRDKELFNLREMFHTRYTLHKRAYKHKTSIIIEAMILDALKAADVYYENFAGSNGKKLSESVDDMVAYTELTDDVLYEIGRSTDTNLETSTDIIKRIARRDLYKCIDKKIVTVKKTEKDVKDALDEALNNGNAPQDASLLKKRCIIKISKFDYSKGNEDPIDYVHFYDKNKTVDGKKNWGGRMQPICEWDILVIYKSISNQDGNEDEQKIRAKQASLEIQAIKEAFEKCSEEWN